MNYVILYNEDMFYSIADGLYCTCRAKDFTYNKIMDVF